MTGFMFAASVRHAGGVTREMACEKPRNTVSETAGSHVRSVGWAKKRGRRCVNTLARPLTHNGGGLMSIILDAGADNNGTPAPRPGGR